MSEHATSGDEETNVDIDIGETVYTSGGEAIGSIRGIKEDGLFVTTLEGQEALSEEHVRSGQSFGEAELMWRCMNCGEMGEIEHGLPGKCPNCGGNREELMYWTED